MRHARGWSLLLGGLLGCEPELSLGRLLDETTRPDAGSDATCAARGPSLRLTDSTEAACGAGSRGFHHALCSCSDLALGAGTTTDGFDSRRAPYAAGERSGSLAANGALFARTLQTGGSLIVAGTQGIPLNGDLTVFGNLFDQGQLQGAYAVSVDGHARVGGDVRVARLSLGRDLTLREGAALEVGEGMPPASRASVDISPPCACAPLDVATLLEDARLHNDNSTVALDPEDGLKAFSSAIDRTLPCGRYYVGAINAQRPITLRIAGRVALYVQDGIVIDNAATLTIELLDDAELDLFVGRGISAGGPVRIGSPSAPTRTRLHFGGPDTLFFASTTTLSASVHAPSSDLVTSAPFELFGAALVRHVASDQTVTLHYDRALAQDLCTAARCVLDSDCAAPLRCDDGACLP